MFSSFFLPYFQLKNFIVTCVYACSLYYGSIAQISIKYIIIQLYNCYLLTQQNTGYLYKGCLKVRIEGLLCPWYWLSKPYYLLVVIEILGIIQDRSWGGSKTKSALNKKVRNLWLDCLFLCRMKEIIRHSDIILKLNLCSPVFMKLLVMWPYNVFMFLFYYLHNLNWFWNL